MSQMILQWFSENTEQYQDIWLKGSCRPGKLSFWVMTPSWIFNTNNKADFLWRLVLYDLLVHFIHLLLNVIVVEIESIDCLWGRFFSPILWWWSRADISSLVIHYKINHTKTQYLYNYNLIAIVCLSHTNRMLEKYLLTEFLTFGQLRTCQRVQSISLSILKEINAFICSKDLK